ncbi:MAG: phage virion morphogenesis protein [Ahrensia sp.]|nr:phage virion morphogenesis protein [Ahrensia sp.]
MSGISLTIQIDNSQLEAHLQALIDRIGNLAPFNKSVGEHMLVSIQENFDNEQGPDGQKWQFHSPVTVENRLRKNGNAPLTILRDTGALAGSFSYEAGADQVEIGAPTNLCGHSAFWRSGRTRQKESLFRRARFWGIGPEDETEIGLIAEDFLKF